MMQAVDDPIQSFEITLYMPTMAYTVFFCAMFVMTSAAACWLTRNVYLHLFGVKTMGSVVGGSITTALVEDPNSSMNVSRNQRTHSLIIEYTTEDGVKRKLEATAVSYGVTDSGFNVGAKLPVAYSRRFPTVAVYDSARYAIGAPVLLLVLVGLLLLFSSKLCLNDIRAQNSLGISSQWDEGSYQAYLSEIIEYDSALRENPRDATLYERRGDAQFAIVQYRDAIEDYTQALSLETTHAARLRLKRAKAEWLDGRDLNAMRDWLASR